MIQHAAMEMIGVIFFLRCVISLVLVGADVGVSAAALESANFRRETRFLPILQSECLMFVAASLDCYR